MKRPYLLKKRGKYWYYRLAGEQTFHSSHDTNRERVENWLQRERIPEIRNRGNLIDKTLRQYLDPFFLEDRCPHVRRLRDEGKSISPSYIADQRRRMEMYVFSDELVSKSVAELRRADVLDFRSRLLAKGVGPRTINRTIGILKIAFKEGIYREELERDPTIGVGEIKYEGRVSGTFSVAEIKALFAAIPGPWRDIWGYTAFLLAAHVGMRRGEILALTWGQIDLDNKVIDVNRAWTDNMLPKYNKLRGTPITSKCVAALKEVRSKSLWVLPDQLVLCYPDGKRYGDTWWKKRFAKAMEQAGIDQAGRSLTPHSLRHTLNSRAREMGVDPAGLRATMGWSDAKVQDGYTHWQDYQVIRDVIEEMYG